MLDSFDRTCATISATPTAIMKTAELLAMMQLTPLAEGYCLFRAANTRPVDVMRALIRQRSDRSAFLRRDGLSMTKTRGSRAATESAPPANPGQDSSRDMSNPICLRSDSGRGALTSPECSRRGRGP